jgi:hypothetical protein
LRNAQEYASRPRNIANGCESREQPDERRLHFNYQLAPAIIIARIPGSSEDEGSNIDPASETAAEGEQDRSLDICSGRAMDPEGLSFRPFPFRLMPLISDPDVTDFRAGHVRMCPIRIFMGFYVKIFLGHCPPRTLIPVGMAIIIVAEVK